eukprot:TRINITY_DN2162_c0_g1_i2.p1 TRINITY_DN2162_c0_g1~~TRINITY_DN2162_c0_g1_i2.p1  ORF type:complete len:307 (-),score=47.75 TRINITY_DN2162_c0_g1_i2:899-1819(-)
MEATINIIVQLSDHNEYMIGKQPTSTTFNDLLPLLIPLLARSFQIAELPDTTAIADDGELDRFAFFVKGFDESYCLAQYTEMLKNHCVVGDTVMKVVYKKVWFFTRVEVEVNDFWSSMIFLQLHKQYIEAEHLDFTDDQFIRLSSLCLLAIMEEGVSSDEYRKDYFPHSLVLKGWKKRQINEMVSNYIEDLTYTPIEAMKEFIEIYQNAAIYGINYYLVQECQLDNRPLLVNKLGINEDGFLLYIDEIDEPTTLKYTELDNFGHEGDMFQIYTRMKGTYEITIANPKDIMIIANEYVTQLVAYCLC